MFPDIKQGFGKLFGKAQPAIEDAGAAIGQTAESAEDQLASMLEQAKDSREMAKALVQRQRLDAAAFANDIRRDLRRMVMTTLALGLLGFAGLGKYAIDQSLEKAGEVAKDVGRQGVETALEHGEEKLDETREQVLRAVDERLAEYETSFRSVLGDLNAVTQESNRLALDLRARVDGLNGLPARVASEVANNAQTAVCDGIETELHKATQKIIIQCAAGGSGSLLDGALDRFR